MARHAAREKVISRFTPLLESGTGLRSRSSTNGRRVYKGVTIIKAGLGNSRDRNFYPVETLERAVKDGRFNGLRAYADHPDSVSEEIQPERTVRDMVGVYDKPRFIREGRHGGRVVADLHLFRSAKWLSDTIDDLLDLGQADKIGLSINGRGKTVEKRLQLEEAADPMDVNYVEDFLVLRSGDVVTEAGAGGGFQQLLESARGHGRTKETAMNFTAKQKKAIKEAVDTNDLTALGKLLKECGCSLEDAVAAVAKEGKAPAAKGKKTEESSAPPAKGKKAKAQTEEVEEAEVDQDDEEAEDDDPDADLDAARDEVVAEAEGDDPDADADEGDDSSLEEDEDLEEAEDDEDLEEADEDLEESEDDEPQRVSRGNGRHPLAAAADKIRSNNATREAARVGGPLKIAQGRKQKIKGPGNGKTAVNIIGGRRKQRGGQKGRKFGEAASPDVLSRENRRLREENARLSNQLRIRTTADRARNLLRESAIPEKLRPEVLRLMVGKSENEMQRIVRYHEKVIGAAIEESTYADLGSGVEGAGARIRESFHGGGRGEDDFGSLLGEVGLPLRGDE